MRQISKGLFRISLLCIALVCLTSAAAQERIVRLGMSLEPGSLDLHADTTTASLNVNQAIFETLVRIDFDGSIIPWLAESWEQLDETTYRFTLREGIRFHSGEPFNAEAVKAHVERMNNPEDTGLPQAFLGIIEETEILGEYALEFRLSAPFGPFLSNLARPHSAIQDTAEYERIGDAFGVNPSGTGPFIMESWNRGSALSLRANPEYWGGAPQVDGLQFRIIPEDAPRTLALERGEIHLTTEVPVVDINRLQANADINLIIELEPRRIHWLMNLEHPILSDITVRRALAHAIDYDFVFEEILGEFGARLPGFMTPETFGFVETTYAYDPELAAALLASAGWELNAQGIYEHDGQPLQLEIMTGNKMPREGEINEAIQALLREFGVDLRINLIEGAQIWPNIARFAEMQHDDRTPDFALLAMDGGMRSGDANDGLESLFSCGKSRNASQYCNPEFDRLREIGVSGVPEATRLNAYIQAQFIKYADVPTLPLWQPSWAIATLTSVEGFRLHPTGSWFYENLSLND